MPMYVYGCPSCGVEVQERRKISQIDDPVSCPLCGDACTREVTTFSLGGAARDGSDATTNGGEGVVRPRHRAGCPCCRPISATKSSSAQEGA